MLRLLDGMPARLATIPAPLSLSPGVSSWNVELGCQEGEIEVLWRFVYKQGPQVACGRALDTSLPVCHIGDPRSAVNSR